MSAPHFTQATHAIASVARELENGRGTTKAERAEMARHLNTARVALRSSIYHGEQPTVDDFAGPSDG